MQTQTRTATPSTVRLRVRVTKTGEATVLDARELSGDVVLSQQARSPVVYELSRRGVAFFAQSLADDPFIAHSYAPPGQPPGHKNVDVESAEITITVPNMTLSRLAADAVGLSIYKVDEARLGATINVDSLSRLKRLQATRTLVSVPGATFQAALRTKLNIR